MARYRINVRVPAYTYVEVEAGSVDEALKKYDDELAYGELPDPELWWEDASAYEVEDAGGNTVKKLD